MLFACFGLTVGLLPGTSLTLSPTGAAAVSGSAPGAAPTGQPSSSGGQAGRPGHPSDSTTTSPPSSTNTSTNTSTTDSATARASTTTTTTGRTPGGGSSSSGTASSTNLLTGARSTFAGTTGGWVAYGASLSWVSSPGQGADGSLAFTSTGTSAPLIASGSPQAGGLVAAAPGHVFEGSASFMAAGSAVAVQPVLGFYTGAGALVGYVWGQQTEVATGGWTALPGVVAITPASATSAALGFVVDSSSAGQRISMVSPSLESVPGGSPAVVGPLRTSGNAILDGNGHRLVLRGINAWGLEDSVDPPVLDEEQIVQAKEWGADMVRIPLGEQLWLSSSCDYSPGYVAAVDQMVNWVTSLGMVALLDLHYDAVGCDAPGQLPMADDPGSITFWQQVAARYAGNPLVAFDLYNEPYGISNSVWLSGGAVTANGVTYQAAGMQQLYDAVRSSGASNLVVVSGNDWANDVPGALLQGTNIAYAVHAYTCAGAAPPSCSTPDPYSPDALLDPWITFGRSQPVLVTEFGWPDQADGTYNQAVIAFAEAQGWGWSVFAFDGTTGGLFDLVSQMPADGPYEPSPSGMPVLAALTGLPSSP